MAIVLYMKGMSKKRRGSTTYGCMFTSPRKPAERAYTTADLARWFRVDVEEIRAWIAAGAKQTSTGWVVSLDQMVGHRRGKGPWHFHMRPAADRQGTSRPPTAARRARKAAKKRRTAKKPTVDERGTARKPSSAKGPSSAWKPRPKPTTRPTGPRVP